MTYDFNTIGALLGLVVAIILIIKKVQPAYSLILGALIGGLIGCMRPDRYHYPGKHPCQEEKRYHHKYRCRLSGR